CRSPMAEFVMKKLVKERSDELLAAGLSSDDFEIASAATSTEEIGNPVYPPAKKMLAAHGIGCSQKRARQMTAQDYQHYDYIIVMDQNNLHNLRYMLPHDAFKMDTKVSMMMDYTNHPGNVADPWYTGDFEATWRDVNDGCLGLLQYIIDKL
ncbi:MAG: low molecular weight phosphotyrosine protein phosphatase, partial [Fibrobacter sp.]|nr:low molecular weight phosphotyrosine protein phosphatase [Fibrobacter sp.]